MDVSDRLFVIPKRDEDLFHDTGNFFIEKVTLTEEDIQANINDFIANQANWWELLEYFGPFLHHIVNPSLTSKEVLYQSTNALYKGFSKMVDAFSTTIPDFVTETESPDEVIIRNINRIRSALPPFIYLLCRMATILESECLKSSGNEKKSKNVKDNFYEDVARLRNKIISLLDTFLLRKENDKSAIIILFEPDRPPEGIPRVVVNYIVKLLSLPENGLSRSEMRQIYSPIFRILAFMGFQWTFMKPIVHVLLDKIHKWDYFKKVTSFIFLQPIMELDSIYRDNFLHTILHYFTALDWSDSASHDKVRPFSLFINTLAEKYPDFVVKEFQSFWKFLHSDQHLIRCAVLSAMEAVVVYNLRNDDLEANYEFISRIFCEILFFFCDSSSFVRNRAATVMSHIVAESFLEDDKEIVGERTKRRFSTNFYAYNFVGKYATLIADPLVSVRKNAVMAVTEILHRNPFDSDMDFNKLVAKYREAGMARENIGDDDENDDEIVSQLHNRFVEIKNVTKDGVTEYFEIGEFPEIKDEPASEDAQSNYFAALSNEFDKVDEKKLVVFKGLNYCFENAIFEPEHESVDAIITFLAEKFNIRNLFNMEIDNRAECIAEERQLQKNRRKDELKKQEHNYLAAAQFALQMEDCMKNAIKALTHSQMAEVNEIVKFLSTCRKFRLRESESAVMQICSLLYRNDAEIRNFVIKAGKDIFFSSNSDEAISEKSTVQNLMQVMLNAKLEDRCVLGDTLVAIFQSEPLQTGSLDFLWNTALGDTDEENIELSLISVQILQSYARANPTEGQKRFHRLTEMLKRKNDGFQIEVLQLATFCRTVVNPTNTKIEELIRPNFRLPSTDEFFQVAIKQLLDLLSLSESKKWYQRAKLTLQALYNLCETPDEVCNDLIGSVLCRVKEINCEFRTFRYLYKKSSDILVSLQKKLRAAHVEMVPTYSTGEDFELTFMKLDREMGNMALNVTQDIFETTDLDAAEGNDALFTSIDPRKPSCYRGFRKFMKIKKRRKAYVINSQETQAAKWLENKEMLEKFESLLNIPKTMSAKHIRSIYHQNTVLFLKTRELYRQWHLILKRLFFLTQQYIVRTIDFVHDSMTTGLENLTRTLAELRKLPPGKVKMLNLPIWKGDNLTAFERDNLSDTSIFKTNKGRMADATEQSVDAVVSAQMDSAVGWDFFKPGSLLMRIWPLVMQTLRFRSRSVISVSLADSAIYCLIKYMLASPNLCRRYLCFIYHYLHTAKPETRSNIIVMLADIAIRHPSTFSTRLDHYLFSIYDTNTNVRYTSLLMIHYLCTVKAIQLSDYNRAQLAMLLIDQNQFISDMVKHFFHEAIKNHHVTISGIVNDVLNRLYKLETKDFDFNPIVSFFFSYIDSVKDTEATTNILCNLLAMAAKEDYSNEHARVFANQLIGCMKLLNKVSLKAVQRISNSLDKFKIFLRRKVFYNSFVLLIKHLKRGHVKPEIKNEIEVFEKRLDDARRDVVLSAKYDRTVRATMRTTMRAQTVEPMQVD